jgi:hypothetical protein
MTPDPEQILPPWRWGPRHWFAVAFFAVLAFVLLRRAPEPATVEPMPTVAAKKPAVRKPATARKPIPAWIGSGKGKGVVKPGVDLTKPTLPPGKYL